MFQVELKKKQWGRLSSILENLGLFSVASIVVPFIFDRPNMGGLLLGLLFALIMWYYSIWLAGKS